MARRLWTRAAAPMLGLKGLCMLGLTGLCGRRWGWRGSCATRRGCASTCGAARRRATAAAVLLFFKARAAAPCWAEGIVRPQMGLARQLCDEEKVREYLWRGAYGHVLQHPCWG